MEETQRNWGPDQVTSQEVGIEEAVMQKTSGPSSKTTSRTTEPEKWKKRRETGGQTRTMDTTIKQQLAMDEALVPTAQRLKIGRSNFRLLSNIKNILHICLRVHGQPFAEPPFEEEILAFIHFLGHGAAIRMLTDEDRSSSDTSITPPTDAVSPRLTASTKGKQTAKASKAKSLSALSEVAMTETQQLKLVTKQSMQQTHISQPSGSGADEGTGSKPGVPDVSTDESEEELSWNSTNNEDDDHE
nr:hypothetical protein [Tanacetum cinerariifolium]